MVYVQPVRGNYMTFTGFFFFLKVVKALKFFKVYNHHNGIQYKTLPRIEQCQVMSSIKLAFIIVSLHLR